MMLTRGSLLKREVASCLLKMICGADDVGKACLVCCQDSPVESLNSAVLKPLNVLHGIMVKTFIYCDVSIVFEDFGEGSEGILFLLWFQICIVNDVFQLVMWGEEDK